MKRARYLVFFELCFVGVLCLATFLFAIFALQVPDGASWLLGPLSFAQIGLTFATLIVTHLTLRTVFRRGSAYEAPAIAASAAFRAVPVVILALGLFHVLLLQSAGSSLREFGWAFTRDWLVYIFALAIGWHVVTAVALKRTSPESA